MTYEGLGEMFEGDSADTRPGKFQPMSMGGRAEGLACADPGVRTPIGVSGNFLILYDAKIQNSVLTLFSSYRISLKLQTA